MRLAIASLVMVGCGGSASSPPNESAPTSAKASASLPAPTGIPRLQLHAGDVLETTEESALESKPERWRANATTSKRRRLEVLAVDGKLITKARIAYPRDDEHAMMSDRPIETKPLDGVYIAAWHDGAYDLANEDGTPLDPEVRRRLLDDVRGMIGQPDFLLDAATGQPLPPIGKPIALPAAGMAMSVGDEAVVKHASLRLLEVKRDVAVFEEVVVFHAVDRATPYAVTALTIAEVSIATGQHVKQDTLGSMSWAGIDFDVKATVRYRYFPKSK